MSPLTGPRRAMEPDEGPEAAERERIRHLATARRWNAPRTRTKRRRVIRADQGARVLELLAQIRTGTLPPESADDLP